MRKSAMVSLLAISVLLFGASPSHAWGHWHGHGGVFIGVGPGFWWGAPYLYWWYPPLYYAPPQVVVQEPPVYIQRQPPSPQGPPEPEASWYYCQSAKGHYPYLQTCPEAWVNVPARPQ
jgi:hypothetical protein